MSRTRVISLSLPKTGTTSLAEALRQGGLQVADWRIRRHETDDTAIQDRLVAELIYEDYFDSGDPLARLDQFDAITEMNAVNFKLSMWPQSDFGLLSAIADHHPGARFILCLRDPKAAARSMLRWNNLAKERLPKKDVPGLPHPFGAEEKHLIRWIEGHYAFCIQAFRGADNFMTYELDDPKAPQQIGAFIGTDLPWWGRKNTTEDWIATQRQEG